MENVGQQLRRREVATFGVKKGSEGMREEREARASRFMGVKGETGACTGTEAKPHANATMEVKRYLPQI